MKAGKLQGRRKAFTENRRGPHCHRSLSPIWLPPHQMRNCPPRRLPPLHHSARSRLHPGTPPHRRRPRPRRNHAHQLRQPTPPPTTLPPTAVRRLILAQIRDSNPIYQTILSPPSSPFPTRNSSARLHASLNFVDLPHAIHRLLKALSKMMTHSSLKPPGLVSCSKSFAPRHSRTSIGTP